MDKPEGTMKSGTLYNVSSSLQYQHNNYTEAQTMMTKTQEKPGTKTSCCHRPIISLLYVRRYEERKSTRGIFNEIRYD